MNGLKYTNKVVGKNSHKNMLEGKTITSPLKS